MKTAYNLYEGSWLYFFFSYKNSLYSSAY